MFPTTSMGMRVRTQRRLAVPPSGLTRHQRLIGGDNLSSKLLVRRNPVDPFLHSMDSNPSSSKKPGPSFDPHLLHNNGRAKQSHLSPDSRKRGGPPGTGQK